jgi:hypothetical protein
MAALVREGLDGHAKIFAINRCKRRLMPLQFSGSCGDWHFASVRLMMVPLRRKANSMRSLTYAVSHSEIEQFDHWHAPGGEGRTIDRRSRLDLVRGQSLPTIQCKTA